MPLRSDSVRSAIPRQTGADSAPLLGLVRSVREPCSVVDSQDLHVGVVVQASEELRRDEEVLPCRIVARHIDHLVVHAALGALVHALVDLVDK